jgi:3-isopropylmalate/(R)-2-methylmalate dehydratase small subunit
MRMRPFKTLTSPAVPLLRDGIDIDLIAPARWSGPKSARAFAALRSREKEMPWSQSFFDRPPFDAAAVLIVGRRFGLGERCSDAVAALRDLGLACLVGVSFAPLFADRAQHAGLVLIAVKTGDAAALAEFAVTGHAMTVDLASGLITTCFGDRFSFMQQSISAERPLSGRQRAGSFMPGVDGQDADRHLFYAAGA